MLELLVQCDEVDEAQECLPGVLNSGALIRAARDIKSASALGERFRVESINLGQCTCLAHQGDAFQAQGLHVLILSQALRDGPKAPT